MKRVSTPQGKQGKFKNFGKTQGKHREFENLKREFKYQENNGRKKLLCDVD